jgi:hypothetical protein
MSFDTDAFDDDHASKLQELAGGGTADRAGGARHCRYA